MLPPETSVEGESPNRKAASLRRFDIIIALMFNCWQKINVRGFAPDAVLLGDDEERQGSGGTACGVAVDLCSI
jgi:hypothetical protein